MTRRRIVHIERVAGDASSQNDEVPALDPDQRRERQLVEIGWIPPNGKYRQPGETRGGREISKRRAARGCRSESTQPLGSRLVPLVSVG